MSNKRIAELEKEIRELREFKQRIELGSRWLMCLIYGVGGAIGVAYTVIEIVKSWKTW